MAPKIIDPTNFLLSLVTKKGKSELYGVYLTGVSVLADAETNYEYSLSPESAQDEVRNAFRYEVDDWNRLLVDVRQDPENGIHPISFMRGHEPCTVFFVCEDREMSAMVFIPTVVVEEFGDEVVFHQELLKRVATFAGKTPTTIRFTIGYASMEWDDLVEHGCARKVDIGY